MNSSRNVLFLLMLVVLSCQGLHGAEVYRWTDENGVQHFSQTPPPPGNADVSKLALRDAQPSGFDPESDIYGVAEQEARMKALREEREKKRQDRLERQRKAASRPSLPSYDTEVWGYPYYPYRSRPPLRPVPPIQRPQPGPGDPIRPPDMIRPPSPLRPN